MKHSILLLTIALFTLVGCKKFDKLTQFNMEYNESVTIPSSTGISVPFNIFTPSVQSNSESTFAVNDTRKDLIEEITLTSLDLTITSPSNGDFSFLNSIEIYISADNVSEIKMAWKENIPSNADNNIELDVTDADLQAYIKSDEFTLRLSTVTDQLLTTDHQINVHSVFFVDAKIFGQ